MNRGDRWVVALAAGLPVVLVLTFLGMMLFYDGRKNIDLVEWIGPEDSWQRELMPGARDVTDTVCNVSVPCVQAVTSETLTMYRFPFRDMAAAAARSFGEDGYASGWIAVRFEPGALTPQDRDGFEYGLGCTNTWVSDDGRDC